MKFSRRLGVSSPSDDTDTAVTNKLNYHFHRQTPWQTKQWRCVKLPNGPLPPPPPQLCTQPLQWLRSSYSHSSVAVVVTLNAEVEPYIRTRRCFASMGLPKVGKRLREAQGCS